MYIIGGLRTPIGKTNGCLRDFLPERLAACLIQELIHKYDLQKNSIEEVILGNVVGPGGNIARLSLLEAALPFDVVGTTVDFQCGSGLKAINLAGNLIRSGQRDIVMAGGVESTSMAPNKQYNSRDSRYKGKNVFYKRAQFSPYSIGDPDMVEGAENIARYCNIIREDMDIWALKSHIRALEARSKGKLNGIIYRIQKGEKVIEKDESIRRKPSLKLIKRAMPILGSKGTITAGNTCGTNDGAALIIMASEKAVQKYGLHPEAIWIGGDSAGIDPNLFPLGAVAASREILKSYGFKIHDMDFVEINEAFAVKVLAFLRYFDYSENKINIFGGALAYGHPYGASGCIIMLHLLEALKDKKKKRGMAVLGIAGGLGEAAIIERCD
ncbi:thiolase family protein [Clostridium sp. LBM24168]